MEFENQVFISSRGFIRRCVHRILVRRLRPQYGRSRENFISDKFLYEKSFSVENVLYKTSPCMEHHCNLMTLEKRIFEVMGLVDVWRHMVMRDAAMAAIATERKMEAGREVLGCWRCGWKRRRLMRKSIFSLVDKGV